MKIENVSNHFSYISQLKNQTSTQQTPVYAKKKPYDQVAVSGAKQPSESDGVQTVEQIADALRKQYPWVTFTFAELGDHPEDIPQFAVSSGNGIHLVIDPDVLDWMAQGGEAWNQGCEMIAKTLHDLMLQKNDDEYNRGAVIADDGEITLWSSSWEKPKTDLEKDFEFMTNILERQEEARERQEEQQKKLKLEQKKKLNYQMGKDMTRLAKGTTDRDIRSLISHMYANRQKIAASSTYNRREVQMALAQMDYVIGRARAKIRHLKNEGELQLRVKKAAEKKEEKRRMQLEQELKSRRRNRIARERAAIYEKMPDLPGLRSEEERREAQAQTVLSGIASGAITPGYGPAAPPIGETSSTVVVSAPSGAAVEVTITSMA